MLDGCVISPPRYNSLVTGQRARGIIAICWVFSIIIGLTPMMGWHKMPGGGQQHPQLHARPDDVPVRGGGGHGVHGLLQLLCLRSDSSAADVGHLPAYLHGRSLPAPADGCDGRSRGEDELYTAERGAGRQVSGHHCRAVCCLLAAFTHHQLLHPLLSRMSSTSGLDHVCGHYPLSRQLCGQPLHLRLQNPGVPEDLP